MSSISWLQLALYFAILLALGVLLVAVPEVIPGLTIPAEMPMQKMP